MVQFETIKKEEKTFGKNNFLEVAKKKAITDEGENEFLSISRGFTTRTGEKRYKRSIAIPLDSEIIEFLLSAVKTMLE